MTKYRITSNAFGWQFRKVVWFTAGLYVSGNAKYFSQENQTCHTLAQESLLKLACYYCFSWLLSNHGEGNFMVIGWQFRKHEATRAQVLFQGEATTLSKISAWAQRPVQLPMTNWRSFWPSSAFWPLLSRLVRLRCRGRRVRRRFGRPLNFTDGPGSRAHRPTPHPPSSWMPYVYSL